MKKKQKRKSRKAEVRIPFPNVLAMVLVCVMAFGLSYVWLCARCDTLGTEIKRLETERRTVRQQAISEQDRWSNMLAPANFERALKHHRLAMKLPDERQVVRVRRGRTDGLLTLANSKNSMDTDAL
ncbi:FtsB/FtsL family cell division protein [Tichowtungia aerotolerans]|uniref:Cell division protein FtsL n=1 Tax=Tichowtungia aerotolerans TaxID=2697043 RepID=A0A6P1MA18_9BACT|nr:hypothetical protein [Tichowtungia aerotolerans]QHI67965.1 hypothetical protein GT409_00380 [Tichowtungia aerotolerans]